MADDVFVYVTAPEGRRTPIHRDDGREPGNKQLHVLPGTVSRVRWSQHTRRAAGRIDLVLSKRNGMPAQTFEEAIAEFDDLGSHRVDVDHTLVHSDGKLEVRAKMTIATVRPAALPPVEPAGKAGA